MCKLSIANRKAEVSVVPTAANLLIKALNEPYVEKKNRPPEGTRHNGNLAFADVVKVATIMRKDSMARTFTGTVKECLGTAQSIGCTVEGKDPRDIIKEVDAGSWDDKIPQDIA